MYIYIGVYFEVSHRIVVYRHVSVCILKYHIVLSCIGLDTGIARPIPVRLVSPDRYLDTGIARPIPGRYLVFFCDRYFACILRVFGRPLRYAPIPDSARIHQNTAQYYTDTGIGPVKRGGVMCWSADTWVSCIATHGVMYPEQKTL